jgi:hypothetical protein
MLVENTGASIVDSGGAYGRAWERNKDKTIDDFEAEPMAWLDIHKYQYKDEEPRWELDPTISLYHKLKSVCDIDPFCEVFNSMPVDDWDSELYYGVSKLGEGFLHDNGFTQGDNSFNSYNWSAIFSQVIQGDILDRDGDKYVLLQVHGGCDVRGGYTDAKLFKLSNEGDWRLFDEACYFTLPDGTALDLMGGGGSWDWLDEEGQSFTDEELDALCIKAGEGRINGEFFY